MKKALTLLALLAIGGCRDQMLPPEPGTPTNNTASNLRIVYTGVGTAINGNDFGSVRADGTDKVPGGDGYLASAPAGSLVAFSVAGRDGAFATVCVANIDGSGRRTVYTPDAVETQVVSDVGLSPDGSRVAFATGDGQIRVIELSSLRETTIYVGGTIYGPPVFSPDSRSIAYCARPDGNLGASGRIIVTELTGARNSTMVSMTALCSFPSPIAWAPNGSSVAYSSVGATATDIFTRYDVSPVGGGSAQAISDDGTYYYGISWSPDGTELAYAGGPDKAHSDIWIVSADGSSRRCITPNTPELEFGPQWSPDGEKLLFLKGSDPTVSEAPGGDIVIYDRTAGESTTLENAGRMVNAYWSLDLY